MHFDLLDKVYYGNTLMDYLISFGVFILSLLVIFIVKNVILRNLKKIVQKTSTNLDNIVVDLIEKKYSVSLPWNLLFQHAGLENGTSIAESIYNYGFIGAYHSYRAGRQCSCIRNL